MKVLEEKKPWNIQVRCTGAGSGGGGCESLLELNEEDIKAERDIYDQYYVYYFKCPVCGICTYFSKRELPQRIRGDAEVKYYTKR